MKKWSRKSSQIWRHHRMFNNNRQFIALGWSFRKAEHQRIDAFKLWCWRKLLRVSWTERRSNYSVLKEI